MLKGKNILLGVTGGIAAYKAANLASLLVKQHANVTVIMTENAREFITPTTFDAITGNRTITDTFDRNHEFSTEHISLSDSTDLVIIAPATANVIAKLVHGIADDMLTTTVLACDCPKLIAPAMNTKMWNNPITEDNIKKAREYGFEIIEPDSGRLACGTRGNGRLREPEEILEAITAFISAPKDMCQLHVLVNAGPTREKIDPVRFISNNSTGKMGYAIASAAIARGAKVTLVSGPTELKPPMYAETINVTSAMEMFNEVTDRSDDADIIVLAAAVADFTPATVSDQKIKKENASGQILLERTPDILKTIGNAKTEKQVVCGFAMESEEVLPNARRKLSTKNLDLIVANCISTPGAGFAHDTNQVTILTNYDEEALPLMSKIRCAHKILDKVLEIHNKKEQ